MYNNFNNNVIKFYNGTNHDISIYKIDNDNFESKRNSSSYYLTNPNIQPEFSISKRIPLNVNSYIGNNYDFYGIAFSLPDSNFQIYPLPGYESYDVIIVSRRYAEAARGANLPGDYLDRLYIVGSKVFLGGTQQLIGNGGLLKLTLPYRIEGYIGAFQSGKIPSLISAKLCLQLYANSVQNHYNYALLQHYIYSEEENRKNLYDSYTIINKKEFDV